MFQGAMLKKEGAIEGKDDDYVVDTPMPLSKEVSEDLWKDTVNRVVNDIHGTCEIDIYDDEQMEKCAKAERRMQEQLAAAAGWTIIDLPDDLDEARLLEFIKEQVNTNIS